MTEPTFFLHGPDRPADWVVTCDHATNRVPNEIGGGTLGLSPDDMARHIAYDIGAAGVATALADGLNAPAVLSNFSRLVIDPNRGEDDPTLVMKLYDGTIIPANRDVEAAETARRLDAYYRPYHRAIAAEVAKRATPILISVHSFTPQFKGRAPRPWQVAVLHTDDTRLSDPLLAALKAEGDLVVGQNEPYTGVLKGDAVDRHATEPGHPNALIEIRNDLIATTAEQKAWAARLALCLDAARRAANL
ncbi:MAG: N-formylglutamate amidohydrolase [Pseudomonadota bacterium]